MKSEDIKKSVHKSKETLFISYIKMIKIIFTISLIVFVFSITTAQENQDNQNNSMIQNDQILKIISQKIPSNWIYYIENNHMIVESKDTIWILSENILKRPKETSQKRANRIMLNGVQTMARLVIKLEDKWSIGKLEKAEETNSNIYNKIKKLPKEHDIVRIAKTGGRRGTQYIPKTGNDKLRIEAYKKAKADILNQLIKLPDIHSQNYSLFILKKVGEHNSFQMVHPKKTSSELFVIEDFFYRYCGK